MKVRKACRDDLKAIAEIYANCFPGEKDHYRWIKACFSSAPKGIYFVAEDDNKIKGYILWCVKNGFRKKSIVELEQIAVDPPCSGKGLGRILIERSFKAFKKHLDSFDAKVGAILVTTTEGNFAEELYKSTLGVERTTTIKNYGSGNELILYRVCE